MSWLEWCVVFAEIVVGAAEHNDVADPQALEWGEVFVVAECHGRGVGPEQDRQDGDTGTTTAGGVQGSVAWRERK